MPRSVKCSEICPSHLHSNVTRYIEGELVVVVVVVTSESSKQQEHYEYKAKTMYIFETSRRLKLCSTIYSLGK